MMLLAVLGPLVLAAFLDLAVAAADPSSGRDSASKFRRLESLTKQCKFVLGGQQFDLCPVLEGNEGGWTTEIERKTPPTLTKTSYQIALQGPLAKDKNATKYDQVSRRDSRKLCATCVCDRRRLRVHLHAPWRITSCVHNDRSLLKEAICSLYLPSTSDQALRRRMREKDPTFLWPVNQNQVMDPRARYENVWNYRERGWICFLGIRVSVR